MPEVKEQPTDVVVSKKFSLFPKKRTTNVRKLSREEIIERLEREVEEDPVLEDGSLQLVDPRFSNEVVAKQYMKINSFAPLGSLTGGLISVVSFVPLQILEANTFSSLACFLIPFTSGFIIDFRKHRKNYKFNKIIDSSALAQKFYPALNSWLKNQYDLTVSEETAHSMISNVLKNISTDFVASDGQTYRFSRLKGDLGCVLRKSNIQIETYTKVLPKKERLALTAESHVQTLTETVEIAGEAESVDEWSSSYKAFLKKTALLKQQSLTSEYEHMLERAQQEASSILQSAALLKQLGDTTYEESLEEAFEVLNRELDSILNSMLTHQRNELAMKKQLIKDRFREPLTLTKE